MSRVSHSCGVEGRDGRWSELSLFGRTDRPVARQMNAMKTKGDTGFDLIASRSWPRHRSTKARAIPQPGQLRPVARWIGQRSGKGRRKTVSGSSAAGSWVAADSAALASKTPLAAALDLAELLPDDIAEFVHHHHFPRLAAGAGDDRPDDSPEQAGEYRQD